MSRPLLLTTDPALREKVHGLLSGTGIDLDDCDSASAAADSWPSSPLVLLGVESVCTVAERGLPRRPNLLLLATDLDDATVWRKAVHVGAEHVVFLPDGERWLLARVAASVAPKAATTLRVTFTITGSYELDA